MILVEQAGASVNGVDMNWLQYQYQTQQQPSFVAQMILSGNAPRPMMQQPMMQQPMYGQPVYPQPAPRSRGGFSTFMNIFVGIFGFVAIIGAIFWGILYYAKSLNPQAKGHQLTIEGGGAIDGYEPPSAETLKSKGLDTSLSYPYWPLVYDMNMVATPDIIMGKIRNYGTKPVKNVKVHFGLYRANGDKVGMVEDAIAQLEPNGVWEYRAKVTANYDQCRLDDITFSQ